MPVKYADYQPFGAAAEVFRRHEDEVVLDGSAGTGKTRGALEKCHSLSLKYPGSRGLIVRKTRASLETTALVTFRQLVLPPELESTYKGVRYPNGAEINFGGMDKWTRIMSGEWDWIYVPEATELTEEEWETLTSRLRWGKIPYQQIIGDCNPRQPGHWLNKRMLSGKAVRLRSVHEDNPILWDRAKGCWTERGAKYIAKLDALTGVRYHRLRLGVWRAAEGLVYDTWDPAVHLIDPPENWPHGKPPQSWPRLWSVDFGYTNPFVFQAWARDPDGRLYRYREIYRTQTLVQDHAKRILEVCAGEPIPVAIVCDHDAEDRATLERHLGMFTLPAYKGVRPGIQAVQQRLKPRGDGRPGIFLIRDALADRDESLAEAHLPTCTEEEIEAYVWASGVVRGRTADEPVKKDDHGLDSTRYATAAADGLSYDEAKEDARVQVMEPYRISPI